MSETLVHDKRIELKYMLDANLSVEVREWARQHLGVEGHCNDSFGDSYDANTLYLDTPEFDLFHRTGAVDAANLCDSRDGFLQVSFCNRRRSPGHSRSRMFLDNRGYLKPGVCNECLIG